VEKTLEGFGRDDFFKDAALLFRREDGLVAVALHPVTEPAANGEVHDVHELHAQGAAVGFAEVGEDVAEGPRTAAAEGAGVEHAVEVGVGEAEGGKGEIGIFGGGQAQRVKMGEGMTKRPVGEEEVVKAGLGKHVTGRKGSGAVAGRRTELATEFEALKKSAPDGLHRGGIGFPLIVKFLQHGGIARMAETTEGGGWSGGGAVGIQPVQDGKSGIRLGRGLKVAHHDDVYPPAFRLSNRDRN
jgi:hypothetical protein